MIKTSIIRHPAAHNVTRTVCALLLVLAFVAFIGASSHGYASMQDRGAKDDQPPTKARVGKPAPDFTLADTTGKEHTLSSYRGRVVVLMWMNRRCPFCERIFDNELPQKSWREIRNIDEKAIWLAVNSTAGATLAENAGMIKHYNIKFPIVMDTDGTVARAYDPRTTPSIFVIDKKGTLVYAGAFDSDPTGADAAKGKPVVNHAVRVVRALSDDAKVDPAKTRPYGCALKLPPPSKSGSSSSRSGK